MNKIRIFDWNYTLMSLFTVLAVFLLVYVCVRGSSSAYVANSRLGVAIALLINYFITVTENRIKTIMIDDNSIIFEITKAFRKNTIVVDRNNIVSLRMFIYTAAPRRICLNFCLKNNNKYEFFDIYYNTLSRNIIKQLYALKDYISDFTYSVAPENSYSSNSLNLYMKNNLQNSLRDNICNFLVFTICSLAIIVLVILFVSQ